MNHIGQTITWGTATAPRLCTGVTTRYSYNDQTTRQLESDEAGDFEAAILHSRKAALSFSAKVSSGSNDFLDLSGGPVLTVSGINTGVVCARRTTELWRLMQRKTVSVEAVHYPDMVLGAGEAAGADVDAFVPAPTLAIVYPGDTMVYSTVGIGHASGVVHELELTQEIELSEDDPAPDGTLVGVQPHGYKRTFRLLLLAKAAAPAVRSVLAFSSSPATRANGYRIENVETRFEDQRGKMYELNGLWLPAWD